MWTADKKFAIYGFFLYLSLLLIAGSAEASCQKQCRGPLRYYEELECKPIFKNYGDACAVAYDCSHLLGRSSEKCYANGNEYNVDEKLRNEDRSKACDVGCYCSKEINGTAKFACALVKCLTIEPKPGCYVRKTLDSCCGAEEICEDRLKCEVDGKTYLDGETFYPKGKYDILCQCLEGYDGTNVSPYCINATCGVELKHSAEVRKNCAPIIESNDSPATSCSSFYRCQNEEDIVIRKPKEDILPEQHRYICKFGNLTLNIGDKISRSNEYPNNCIQCACDVPPTLTCRQLSDEECQV